MTETIIVRFGEGFLTYSGWVINRTPDALVFAALSAADAEPTAMIIPLASIVSETSVAA